MLSYAGIGSRTITDEERDQIFKIACALAPYFTVYSGNADGSDVTFQRGSGGNCILMLPWKKFNKNAYPVDGARAWFDVGTGEEGDQACDRFHPASSRLSPGARKCIVRNYYQIAGYGSFPRASFVVCCADQEKGEVIGGTGHAVRIAKSWGIPVFNIRQPKEEWHSELRDLCNTLKGKSNE